MSCEPVCQTENGDLATSISPPPSGVVATTLKVGSSIVSARAAIVARARRTPADAMRAAILAVIFPPCECRPRPKGIASQAPGAVEMLSISMSPPATWVRLAAPGDAGHFNDGKLSPDELLAT